MWMRIDYVKRVVHARMNVFASLPAVLTRQMGQVADRVETPHAYTLSLIESVTLGCAEIVEWHRE